MVNRKKNAQRFKKGLEQAHYMTSVRGVIVAVVQDSGTSIFDESRGKNYVWVRPDENDTQELPANTRAPISVRNMKVQPKEGIYVEMARNATGTYEITGLDQEMMDQAYQELAPSYASPAKSGEINTEIIPGWRFKPLRVRADASGGLTVFIEPGRYEYLDVSYVWDSNVTALDLASIAVSSNMKRPVIVGIDPVAGTPVAVAGAERTNTTLTPPVSLTEYNELINANIGKLWLFGYERKSGVSLFQSIRDLVDLRAWLSVGSGVSSGSGFMPIQLNFPLTIPVNRQVPVRRLYVVAGGSLIVNGALDVF